MFKLNKIGIIVVNAVLYENPSKYLKKETRINLPIVFVIVSMPSQESEWSSIYVLMVAITPLF